MGQKRGKKRQIMKITRPLQYMYYCKYWTVLNTEKLFNAAQFGSLRQNKFAILDKQIVQFETIAFGNFEQIHFAVWEKYRVHKYIRQYKTNTFVNIRKLHFAIVDKYIQFETTTFYNLRKNGDQTDQTYHFHVWSTRHMVTELLNLRNGQSPVSVCQSRWSVQEKVWPMTPPVNTCGPPQIQNTMMNVTVKEGQEATFKCMVRISHVMMLMMVWA